MTSANLAYSIRNLLKRMLWFPALGFFVFLFAGTIANIMPLQRLLRWMAIAPETEGAVDYSGQLNTLVNNAFSYQNPSVGAALIVAAFAAGLIFFHYMHNRQQVDFYHSLPIRRANLYWRHYIAGALASLLPWLINLLLTALIIIGMGQGAYISINNLLLGCGIHLLLFLSLYSLAVLASLLAGNGVVAGILAALFWGFGPMALAVFNWLRSAMQPAWYPMQELWDRLYAYSSPAARYITLYDYNLPLAMRDIVWLSLLIVISVALGLLIYRARASEAAGRALSFAKTRAFIKYPVMLLCMGFVAMLLHEMGDDNGGFMWFMVGAALGGFISAQIMEIVYALDFRAIRRRLLPFVIVTLLFCGGAALGFLDTFGYNSYLPDKDQVVKVELYLSNGQGQGQGWLNNYCSQRNQPKNAAEQDLIRNAPRREALLPISSQAGIAAAISIVEQQMQGADWELSRNRNSVYYSVIRYHLADGSVKTRQSRGMELPLYLIADELDAISAEPGYRAASWPLFSADPASLRLDSVIAYEYGAKQQDIWNENGHWLQQDISALLIALEAELTAMDSAEQRNSMPIGNLIFLQYADAAAAASGLGRYQQGLYVEYNYPLYPEFTRSIAALAELGFAESNWQPYEDNIQSATLYWNTDDYSDYNMSYEKRSYAAAMPIATREDMEKSGLSGGQTITLEFIDREEIRLLIDNSWVWDAVNMNPLRDVNQASRLVVYYSDIYGNIESQERLFALGYTPPQIEAMDAD